MFKPSQKESCRKEQPMEVDEVTVEAAKSSGNGSVLVFCSILQKLDSMERKDLIDLHKRITGSSSNQTTEEFQTSLRHLIIDEVCQSLSIEQSTDILKKFSNVPVESHLERIPAQIKTVAKHNDKVLAGLIETVSLSKDQSSSTDNINSSSAARETTASSSAGKEKQKASVEKPSTGTEIGAEKQKSTSRSKEGAISIDDVMQQVAKPEEMTKKGLCSILEKLESMERGDLLDVYKIFNGSSTKDKTDRVQKKLKKQIIDEMCQRLTIKQIKQILEKLPNIKIDKRPDRIFGQIKKEVL